MKVVITKDIQSNEKIFNYHIIKKTKISGIYKIYEKNRFIIQVYNNQEKDLILIQLLTI